MHQQLWGIGDGVGGIGAVTDVVHGADLTVKIVQVFPGWESVLYGHSAAVLQRSHPHLHRPAGHLQHGEPGAEAQHEGLLFLE